MISEYFLDICLRVGCSTTPSDRLIDFFDHTSEIIKWNKKHVKMNKQPSEFQDKLDILEWIINYRIEKSFDLSRMLSSISEWKHGEYVKYLEELSSDIPIDEFNELYKLVLNRRKLCLLFTNAPDLKTLLTAIEDGNMVSDEEVIRQWETVLTSVHDDLMTVKKTEETDTSATLDIMNDDYKGLFSSMVESVDESKILNTGFKYLKDILVTGGFENRRLYLIGGSSGVGKSTMLINLISNAAKCNKTVLADSNNTYLYITAENLIDETWIRLYCCMTGTPHQVFVDDLKDFQRQMYYWKQDNSVTEEEYEKKVNAKYNTYKNQIKDILNQSKSNIIFRYVPSGVSTSKDIKAIVDSVSKENNLRALFVDYLDLFTSGKNLDTRFDLAHVSQSLKNIAIDYNIPVITATQLNRDGYNPEAEPRLTQMGESMEKVNKSDFVLFLQDANPKTFEVGDTIYKQIRMTVLKQRNGRTGETVKVSMRSTRNNVSVFNFKIEENNISNIPEVAKTVKQVEPSKIVSSNMVPVDSYFVNMGRCQPHQAVSGSIYPQKNKETIEG